jgi:hypothetical protein
LKTLFATWQTSNIKTGINGAEEKRSGSELTCVFGLAVARIDFNNSTNIQLLLSSMVFHSTLYPTTFYFTFLFKFKFLFL